MIPPIYWTININTFPITICITHLILNIDLITNCRKTVWHVKFIYSEFMPKKVSLYSLINISKNTEIIILCVICKAWLIPIILSKSCHCIDISWLWSYHSHTSEVRSNCKSKTLYLNVVTRYITCSF